ncbi:UNVERIFIED_CONTAM: hypothetical protein FKN15_070022 [Acipenser sinensis]
MKCLREKGQGPRIDQYFLRSQSSQSNEIQRQEANHSSQDISTPVIDVRRTCMDTVSDEPNDPCEPEEGTGYGPVFQEQPIDTIYAEESPEAKVTMNCRARGNPAVVYKWKLNGWDIPVLDTDDHYTMVGGNLMINNPEKSKDEGRYQCVAKNIYGSVVSRVVTIKFGYLDPFLTEERSAVSVKVGQGAVLLCAPPPHYPDDLSYRWLLNEFPIFITPDNRKFVSQTTGNLYISNVDPADKGNYSCFVSSASIAKSVFSKFISLAPQDEREKVRKYPADIKVRFPDTYTLVGQNVSLECFALGNPNPKIVWRKVDAPFPSNYEMSLSGSVFTIFNVQVEDEGLYECEALNIKGKDRHQARVYTEAYPEWAEHINDTEKDIGSDLTLRCEGKGIPKPTIRWLKNGIGNEDRGDLFISNVQLRHAGRYTCTAQTIVDNSSASADLVVRGPPGPPGGVRVEEIRDSSVKLTWSRGTDNHSPISRYTIQGRSVLWEDWKTVKTSPTVAPSDIGGGGGRNRELTITWTECIIKKKKKNVVKTVQIKFLVNIGAPIEAPTGVTARSLSSSEAQVSWVPVVQHTIEGYEVRYWRTQDKEAAAHRVQVSSLSNSTRLENTLPDSHYHIEVRAFNAAGYGPPSELYDIYTKKAPPSRPPKIVSKYIVGSRVSIVWDHVEPLANESRVEGYKVLYRREGQPGGMLYSTGKHYIDIPVPKDGEYIVEVRAHSEGGDGAVAQVLYRREGQPGGMLYSTGKHYIDVPVPKDGEYIVEVRAHSEGGDGAVAQVKITDYPCFAVANWQGLKWKVY